MPYVPVNCTSCGGEIQLDDTKEFGFCMHCGTKVIFQEAIQKIEITNLPKVDNLLKIANAEFEVRHYAEAIKYYNRVLELDTENWKAILYKALSQCYETPIEGYSIRIAISGAEKAFKLAKDELTYDLIRVHFLNPIDNIIDDTIQFADNLKFSPNPPDLNNAMRSDAFFTSLEKFPNFGNFLYFCVEGYEYCVKILENYPKQKADRVLIYKKILFLINWFFEDFNIPNIPGALESVPVEMSSKFDKYEDDLLALDPNANIPDKRQSKVETKKGCYVATAVYGSYNAPQVLVLREYRDNILLKKPVGRVFVKFYYWVSPKIVTRLHGKTRIHSIIKSVLDKIVANIQKQ